MGKLRHDLQKELIMVYYAKQEVMKPPASSSEIFFCSFFLLLYFLHVYALLVPGATNKKKNQKRDGKSIREEEKITLFFTKILGSPPTPSLYMQDSCLHQTQNCK
jgi:hypothetical protein